MLTDTPAVVGVADTTTRVSGLEKWVAFSISSASRCATVSACRPETSGSSVMDRSTRSKDSISPTAVRITSDRGSAVRSRRAESRPARTRRLSAFRRIRVARWSSEKSRSRTSGSSSVASIWSSAFSCRPSSTWLRRATLTNISAMLARSAACSLATRTVTWLTVLNASARRPISSADSTSIGSTVTPGPSPGVCMRSTMRGSSSPISPAATVRRRSGRVIRRARATARMVAKPRPMAARPIRNSDRSSWARSMSRALSWMSVSRLSCDRFIASMRVFAAPTQLMARP